MHVTGVAAFLLFLGSVIPPLRGDVTETNDPEYADGLSVRNLCNLMLFVALTNLNITIAAYIDLKSYIERQV